MDADLTPREREIAAMVALGMSTSKIADALFLSRRTIECHRASINRKRRKAGLAPLPTQSRRRVAA